MEMMLVIGMVDIFVMEIKMDTISIKNKVEAIKKVMLLKSRYNGSKVFLIQKE